MGNVYFGIPEFTSLFFKKEMNLNTFVEGGTYIGGTAKKMSSIFEKVITIEKSDVMFNKAKENLNGRENIILLKGDTRYYLKEILKENNNILFWLDSHWSGGDTYGKEDECPLIEELNFIFNFKKNYAILIDDARLFLSPPPLPHNYKKWPDIRDIIRLIPSNFDITILEDVIYVYPNSISDKYKNFIQIYITEQQKRQKKRNSLINTLKGIIKNVIKR